MSGFFEILSLRHPYSESFWDLVKGWEGFESPYLPAGLPPP